MLSGLALRLSLAAVAFGITFLSGMYVDHKYGPNAYKLAKIERATAEKNAVIREDKVRDAEANALEKEKAKIQDREFAERSQSLSKCELSRDQAEALSTVGRD